ncbi:MAG: beta-ketoacyl synthase N-terminal-like domain-containing protein [Flavobacteriaceae bacterium]
MKPTIGITAIASISPLGGSLQKTWESYLASKHLIKKELLGATSAWVASIPKKERLKIEEIRASNSKYDALDETVLYALSTCREAVKMAGWKSGDRFGINIGSSRGATGLFEKYHEEFIKTQNTSTLSSPTTTLGNIASWVSHDLGAQGPTISHSITCSTALHAVLNGIAWIKAGLTEKFLVGGSEAPLTPFTIAQMRALKIYSEQEDQYPSRAMDPNQKHNSMVLGEGASVACLESGISKKTLALIEGVGYATEPLEHNVSISSEAICFQKSMKMALGNLKPEDIDIVVMHAPGTLKGDSSELKAIERTFGKQLPALTGNKWMIGHTFGASGMLSVELAVLMLQHQQFIPVPFLQNAKKPNRINRVLVNAVGFGGNAVSIIVKRPGE